jgi:hypothetical protein
VVLSSPDAWRLLTEINTDVSAVTEASGLVDLSSGVAAPGGTYLLASPEVSFFLVASGLPKVGGSPKQKVGSLLRAVAEDRDVAKPDQLSVVASATSPTGRHVVAQQRIRGTDVVGAVVTVHERNGRPYCLTGSPLGDLSDRDPGKQPRTTLKEAQEETRRLMKLEKGHRVSAKRVIFPLQEGAIWAFDTRVILDEPIADVRSYLGAENMDLLVRHNVASARTPRSLQGKGRVYAVNPLRTPDLKDVILRGIGPEPRDKLYGSAIKVDPFTPPPISNADRSFLLSEKEPGFDEVQTFFHLGEALKYYRSLLGDLLIGAPPFTPVTAIVRDPRSFRNAFFMPDTGELRFGDFDDRPSARSADIIFHELGHAVSDGIARIGRGFMPHSEARGMSEGYSDYFACSALNDPRVGDYVKEDSEGARNLEKSASARFPAGYVGEEHVTGEVWASLLWALREEVGKAIVDRVVLESLHFVNRNSRFADGVEALKTATANVRASARTKEGLTALIDAQFQQRAP